MTKIIILPEETLDGYYVRALARLRENWRMKHPEQKWRKVEQPSLETHVSANDENPEKGESIKVF